MRKTYIESVTSEQAVCQRRRWSFNAMAIFDHQRQLCEHRELGSNAAIGELDLGEAVGGVEIYSVENVARSSTWLAIVCSCCCRSVLSRA